MGWAQGPDGKPTTDAELALKTSALMPLGGAEITSGFKGYALALMVETFCGMLGGEFFFRFLLLPRSKEEYYVACTECVSKLKFLLYTLNIVYHGSMR